MVAMFTPHFNASRFYNDDGGEAGSTQIAAQDTNINPNVDSDFAFQFRARIDETGGADGTTMDDYQVQYDKNSTGFVDLTTTDSGDGIRAVAAGLTNDNATTNRSSDPISDPGSGVFVDGEQSTDGLVDNMLLTNANFTEHVYGIELVSANVANNDTFDFQLSTPGAIVNNVVPRVTVVKTGITQQAIAATAVGAATLTRGLSFLKAISATAVGAVVLGTVPTFVRFISVTATGVASLSAARLVAKAISAVASGVVSLSKVPTFVKAIEATATGVASLTRVLTLLRAIAATAVGVAVLATNFIAEAVKKLRRSRIGRLIVNPGTLLRR